MTFFILAWGLPIVAAANAAKMRRDYILYNYLSNIHSAYNLGLKLLAPYGINNLLNFGKLDTLCGIIYRFSIITSKLNIINIK